MTPERFAHLADAYGAQLQHWPTDERLDAQAMIDRGDTQALECLKQARWLDERLDSHQAVAADAALTRRVIASAPTAMGASFWLGYNGWLSRLGFVGAALTGIAVGMLTASLSLPLPHSTEALPSVFDQGDADIVFNMDAEDTDQ